MGQPISAGIVGAIAGFATSFALVIAALQAMGATAAQASSGLLALCLVTGTLSILFTLWLHIPISFAWSTPGAALLIAAGTNSANFAAAVGAFIVCALLILLCGLWPALGALITRIPRAIASAMLAGILFPICLAPVQAAVELPALALPIVITWLVLMRLAPRWAVPAAMAVTIVIISLSADPGWLSGAALSPQLVFVPPVFDPFSIVSIGVPLFIVTMAGQNVPGFAVMKTFGYTAPHRAVFVGTGIASGAATLFGGHAINLAAITAAIMASPEAGEDRERRWIAPMSAGIAYLLLGLGAGLATALVSAAPSILIVAVAGLAVMGALVASITAAFEQSQDHLAAIATFLVVASGVVIMNIGSAFWGLLVGGAVMLWLNRRPKNPVQNVSAPHS